VACALDQGLVTTLTGYDTTGAVMKFGDGASAVLWNRFCLRIDNLSARLAGPRLCSAQRTALSRRIARLRRRMTNAVSSAMHEYAKVLCKRYRYIFLPHFKVSEMVKGSPLGKRQGCHGSRPCAVETAAGAEGDSLRLHRHVCAYHHTTQCLSAVCVRGGAAAVAVVVTVTCSVLFESVSLRVGCWRLVARPPPSR
jgi:transposase